MIEILHDLIYQNRRNSGSMLYMRSCRIIAIINCMTGVGCFFSGRLRNSQAAESRADELLSL